MRTYLAVARNCALVGMIAGAALALSQMSDVWPRLSYVNLAHRVALGWLLGLLVSPLAAALVRRRRPTVTSRRAAPWRTAANGVLGVVALAPALIWLNTALPGRLGSRLPRVARPIGDTRPNIILITIDALRPDHLGAYGSSAGLTPNLDAFAQEATRYQAAYAPAPWTLPSFGAVFTSRPPSQCGLKTPQAESTDWYTHRAKLPDAIPLLSENLRSAGYVTAAEITNPFLSDQRGWNRGFDYFRNEDLPNVRTLLTSNTARAHTVTEHARLWLRLNPREPFFLWVHYLDPHAPYDSPDTPSDLRARFPREWETGRDYWLDHMQQTPPETQAQYADFRRAMYAEEVRYADRWLGQLLKELKRTGRYRRSLIVLTSDHGEELFDHGGVDHGHTMHEELLWVPLLVKWPEGWKCDERVGQIVGLLDLGPTFLDVARAQPLQGACGRVLPTRDGGPGEDVYSEAVLHGAEQTALTTADRKVICHPHDSSGAPRFEVYDRLRDRAEQRDLAGLPAALAHTARLWEHTQAAHRAALRWHPPTGKAGPPLQLDQETQRQLRALGYIGN